MKPVTKSKLGGPEARRLAYDMKMARKSYPEIAAHLRALGYVSGKTKQAVSDTAVRHMVICHCRDNGLEFPGTDTCFYPDGAGGSGETADEPVTTGKTAAGDVISNLRAITAMPAASAETKLKLIEVLLGDVRDAG